MNNFIVRAARTVNEEVARQAQMGPRFGRLDLASQLAVLAVDALAVHFQNERRDRLAICLVAGVGSLSTDVEYWQAKDAIGGPSPTLFAYTLPSAAIGEIAIRHQLTGPNFCWVGADTVLEEACHLIRRGEVDGCICVACTVISAAAAVVLEMNATAKASALFLHGTGEGYPLRPEIDRDIESVCQLVSGLATSLSGSGRNGSRPATP